MQGQGVQNKGQLKQGMAWLCQRLGSMRFFKAASESYAPKEWLGWDSWVSVPRNISQ